MSKGGVNVNLAERLKRSWNAFIDKDSTNIRKDNYSGSYYRPDRVRLSRGNERSIVTSVLNRIALDAASIMIKHCKLDKDDRFEKEINSAWIDLQYKKYLLSY